MLSERQARKAQAVWEELYTTLREAVFEAMDRNKLNAEQQEYVENKLHEELRYWKYHEEVKYWK